MAPNHRAYFWLASALLVFAAAQIATAQGGQGGFGGGGFGGGLNPGGPGDHMTGKSILTPGQYGEWPLTVREGETIIVHVSSSAFDPAVELVDSKNKVVAQNDDIRTGEQDAQLLHTFASAGKYRVLVKAFKGAGGGQYDFDLRRFTAVDAQLGRRMAGSLDATRARWFRVRADRGKTLIVIASAASYRPSIEVFSPIGEARPPDLSASERSQRAVYEVETAGDQYVRIGGPPGERGGDSYAVTIAFAREFASAIGQAPQRQRLEAGGMDVWKIPVKAGDLIRVRAVAEGGVVAANTDLPAPETKQSELAPGEDRAEPMAVIETNRKSPGELVALLNRAGTLRVSVAQPQGLPASYSFACSSTGRSWREGDSPSGSLRVGQSDYWLVDGKAGRIIQLAATSESFDTTLDMFGPNGQRVGYNDDGAGKLDSLLTQLLAKTGRYIVRIHANGDGGSGPYRLQWLPDPVRPLALGSPTSGNLGAGAAGIWSFAGRKDQTVIVSARSTDFDTVVHVYGPDGLEIANVDDGGDGTDSLAAIRLPLDGTYTLWVTGKYGAGSYTIRVIDADK